MFKPGCLTRARLPGCHAQHRCIYDLQYQVRQDPDHGPMLQVQMRGEVDGKPFTEDFELYRDTAYNVFSRVAHRRASWPAAARGADPGGPRRVRCDVRRYPHPPGPATRRTRRSEPPAGLALGREPHVRRERPRCFRTPGALVGCASRTAGPRCTRCAKQHSGCRSGVREYGSHSCGRCLALVGASLLAIRSQTEHRRSAGRVPCIRKPEHLG